jgi:hypothetical protein
VLQKEQLTGYIEVLLENEAGIANLFLVHGELMESLLAPPYHKIIAESIAIEKIQELCQKHGAVFNVYQSGEVTATTGEESAIKKSLSPNVIKLFETIFVNLESVTNATFKAGAFQTIFKAVLPRSADKYAFLDPFIGDFRYVNKALSYSGDATCEEFVDGMCEVITNILKVVLNRVPESTFLPQLSRSLESVSTTSSDLIEKLQLEARIPAFFQDYSYFKTDEANEESRKKSPESYKVLNLQGIGVSEIGSDNILREFYRAISVIVEKYVESGGQIVHYTRFKKSNEFQRYHTATAFLQQFNLSYLKSHPEKLAFWLNLYNFLVLDAVLEFGIKTSIQDVKGFFTKASYRLGGNIFNLDDIEHGILRNNERRPYSFFRQFAGADSRKAFCLNPPDHRVHCCFFCAAKSCPPLTVYTPKNLDRQLDQAVIRYLLTNGMRINEEKYELWLNRTFYWYRKDFESKGTTVLDFVINALEGRKIGQFMQKNRNRLTLHFMDYDWSLNGD